MLQIPCICCGPRDETEFVCGGTSHLCRPLLGDDDAAWGAYLFFRENPKGLHVERWRHVQGCGQWFNIARNTVTHEISAVYAMTAAPPTGVPATNAPSTGAPPANAPPTGAASS